MYFHTHSPNVNYLSLQNYLHQFGYIDVDPRTRTAQPVDLRRALIEFQQFTGLPVTGRSRYCYSYFTPIGNT